MSCRSQSGRYKLALTDRFTDHARSRPFDIHKAQPYTHTPLRDPSTQCRYLYLLPKQSNVIFNGRIIVRCELRTHTYAPFYIGLSYTWGDPESQRPIAVGDKVFQATENLAIALEHLQDEKKTIIFWIDAICIDQSNLDEKSIQVQRMGNIFASATLVLAWLGPAADESELALREMMRYNYDSPDSYKEFKNTFSEIYVALPIESINAFFDRPWFKRVWVGQEVALNKEVVFVCGQLDIQREKLLECYMSFMFFKVSLGESKLSASFARFEATKPLPLHDFLLHVNTALHLSFGKNLESSDPRDFIYSSLGRLSSLGDGVIGVDYSKRVEDVYTEFAVAVIRVGMVHWLSYNWRPSVNYEDLPSWVPDWSNTEPCRDPHDVKALEYNIVEVCEIERGCKALKISARCITQISSIIRSSKSEQESFSFDLSTSAIVTQQEEARVRLSLDTIRQALDDKERWSHEDAERAVYDLSSGMSMFRTFGHDDAIWEGDLYESYKAFRGLEALPSDVADPRQWRREASRAYLKILQEPNVENLFVTAADIVGTSRDKVQPGDWVCVLGGVRNVWILREVEGGFYRIVSLANVFPWGDVENSDAPVETITII